MHPGPRTVLLLLALWLAACTSGGDTDTDTASGSDAVADTDTASGSDTVSGSDAVSEKARPLLGLLQFHVEHNLADDGCVAGGNCSLRIEDETGTAAWLNEIRDLSTLAVLHFDQSLPWHVFAEDAPADADLVAFYEERFDPALRDWLHAFAAHFAQLPTGYVAVPLLGGARDRLQPLRWSTDERELPVTEACPDLSPERVFEVDTPDGPVSFPLGQAWVNAARYFHHRFGPRFLALGQEVNMFRVACPEQWPSLVSLYRYGYDTLRPELPEDVQLFTTLTWQHVLDYSMDSCFYPLPFHACDDPSAPPAFEPVYAGTCFPMDVQALWDLDEGERLEILALSFYPDALSMAPPDVDAGQIRIFAAETYPEADCQHEMELGPFLDPFAPLDELGWTKPVALAEISARSCPTLAWNDEWGDPVLIEAAGTPGNQAWWLQRVLELREERELAFAVWSFLRDYDVLGPWLVDIGLFDPWTFSVMNTWPCSGLTDREGNDKAGVTALWREALGVK